jgi:hypothetical protein
MSSEAFLRTVSTIASADKYNPDNSIFKPAMPVKTAPVMRQSTLVQPYAGNAYPGTKGVRFRIPRDANVLGPVFLVGTAAAITLSGTATFARYIDYLGINWIKEVKVKSGTQLLQTITRDQLYVWLHKKFDDEQRLSLQSMVLGPLSQAERNQRAKKLQRIRTPLPVFWAQNNDPSNYLHLFGLSNEIELEFEFEESKYLFQSNGTYTAPATDSAVYTNVRLECEFYHTMDSEREQMQEMYQQADGMEILYEEVQAMGSDTTSFAAATSLSGGTVTINIPTGVFNKPAAYMVIFLRWAADLSRSAALLAAPSSSFGEYGCDRYNVDGWTDPKWTPYSSGYPTHGNPSPLIVSVAGKSGSNYWLPDTRVEDLINDTSGWRYAHGGGGAILYIPFAQFPNTPNSCTGALDFGAVPNAQLVFTLNTSDWTLGGTDYTTVGNYATADIGESSALQVDVLTFNYDTIKIGMAPGRLPKLTSTQEIIPSSSPLLRLPPARTGVCSPSSRFVIHGSESTDSTRVQGQMCR